MLPDWVSNPGPLTYESGALLLISPKDLDISYKMDVDFGNCFGRGKKPVI